MGANRGASGIDGVLSSAAGFAEGLCRGTTLVIGDVSFLHDVNGLNLLRTSGETLGASQQPCCKNVNSVAACTLACVALHERALHANPSHLQPRGGSRLQRSGLHRAGARPPLTVVLVNNGGGGIFSFLPAAEQIPADAFTELWATPQHVDLMGACPKVKTILPPSSCHSKHLHWETQSILLRSAAAADLTCGADFHGW